MNFFWRTVIGIVAVVVGSAVTTSAFERDTHYYATYALALTTCFDWEEAHLIASADVMIDGSRGTVAELIPTNRRNKAAWHAFGHNVERYYELWQRALAEPSDELRLIAFGQFLHYLQDWESHAGYPVHLGHAKATVLGHDPDSMARSEARTRHSIQATLDHMALLCRELDRLPAGLDDSDRALAAFLDRVLGEQLVRDLIDASDPGWRATMKGGLTDRGARIMAENVLRIERYLEQQIAPLEGKGFPADFEPGSDAHGIPEPLELDFDGDGALLSDLDDHLVQAGRHPEDDHLDPPDHHIHVASATPIKRGWRVRFDVTNAGDKPMPPGEVVAVAIDALEEEHLGEAFLDVPEIGPDETRRFKLVIPTSRPTETALIGVSFSSIHDRDPHNSDVWHMTAEDLSELEAHVAAYGTLHGLVAPPVDASLEIIGAPELWLTGRQRLCAAILARGATVDPSIHVESPEFALDGGEHGSLELGSAVPTVWTITPSHPDRVPAVKSYACFPLDDAICGQVGRSGGASVFSASIAIGEARLNAVREIGFELADTIQRACRERFGAE